ncbi:hypothetical protein niasHS_000754 [Heterodera schachtii]|uniref:Uncharacterized protein n=1 Tax=Heterodera schachtii TaxID=97005 RepID=A0ABD2KL38_HETSC
MMQQNAFATDFRLRCKKAFFEFRPSQLPQLVVLGLDRLLAAAHQPQHRADHDRHTNRKPDAPGLLFGVFSTQPPNANAPVSGRTVVYTVYRCRRVGARPLSVTFPHDNDARMDYVSALERAQMLLGLHHLPPLAIWLWPYAHAFGPSRSGAAAVAG